MHSADMTAVLVYVMYCFTGLGQAGPVCSSSMLRKTGAAHTVSGMLYEVIFFLAKGSAFNDNYVVADDCTQTLDYVPAVFTSGLLR